MSAIIKRSITVAGHPTSISLEQEFWDALQNVARQQGLSVPDLVAAIDRTRDGGLSSALRVYIVKTIRPSDGNGA